MYSGKTTETVNSVKRYHHANKKCLIIRHNIDNRYEKLMKSSDSIMNHDFIEYRFCDIARCGHLSELNNFITQYDVIGIDELGFFDDLLIVNDWANMGKIIIASSIDGDYKQKGFNEILHLIPLAEEVRKLKAVCQKCYADASFTIRLNKDNTDDENIVVGASNLYMAVCRECLNKHDV
jgi:thymidine kinase